MWEGDGLDFGGGGIKWDMLFGWIVGEGFEMNMEGLWGKGMGYIVM